MYTQVVVQHLQTLLNTSTCTNVLLAELCMHRNIKICLLHVLNPFMDQLKLDLRMHMQCKFIALITRITKGMACTAVG